MIYFSFVLYRIQDFAKKIHDFAKKIHDFAKCFFNQLKCSQDCYGVSLSKTVISKSIKKV